MTTRKEALSRLTKKILDTRSDVRIGLENVEKDLREGMNGLTVNARGKRVTFGQVDEDDWEYGVLSFDGTDLRVLTSTTMDDAHNYGKPWEGHMTSRHLNEIKDDEIITKLASPESISAIWNAVEEQVNEMLGEAKSSAKILSEFSDIKVRAFTGSSLI